MKKVWIALVLILSGCDPVFAKPCQDKVCIRVYTDPKTGRVVIEANKGKPGATSTPKPKKITPRPSPTRTWKPRPYTPRPYTPRPYTSRPKVSRKPTSLSDQLSRLIPGSLISKAPVGDVLVQVPVKFSTNTNLLFQTAVTILGTAVQVNLTPQFNWDFGDGIGTSTNMSPSYTYTAIGNYNVTLTASNNIGCSNTITLGQVMIIPNGNIFFPLAFTPNGDGINDSYDVKSFGLHDMQFTVFDRWGEVLFQSSDVNASWDGTFKGKPVSGGVYLYTADVNFNNGTHRVYKGEITLLQ